MKGRDTLFSSATHDWETPRDLIHELDLEFGFQLDAAADASNHLCDRWMGPGSDIAEDALSDRWQEHDQVIFCNPPYKDIAKWVAHVAGLFHWAVTPQTVVMLLPARTDTRWFHEYILAEGAEVRFIKGRLKFGYHGVMYTSAPFPSMVVIFRKPSRWWSR
jgi:site-specific DNA-methyltransferase (adenine-specific)